MFRVRDAAQLQQSLKAIVSKAAQDFQRGLIRVRLYVSPVLWQKQGCMAEPINKNRPRFSFML